MATSTSQCDWLCLLDVFVPRALLEYRERRTTQIGVHSDGRAPGSGNGVPGTGNDATGNYYIRSSPASSLDSLLRRSAQQPSAQQPSAFSLYPKPQPLAGSDPAHKEHTLTSHESRTQVASAAAHALLGSAAPGTAAPSLALTVKPLAHQPGAVPDSPGGSPKKLNMYRAEILRDMLFRVRVLIFVVYCMFCIVILASVRTFTVARSDVVSAIPCVLTLVVFTCLLLNMRTLPVASQSSSAVTTAGAAGAPGSVIILEPYADFERALLIRSSIMGVFTFMILTLLQFRFGNWAAQSYLIVFATIMTTMQGAKSALIWVPVTLVENLIFWVLVIKDYDFPYQMQMATTKGYFLALGSVSILLCTIVAGMSQISKQRMLDVICTAHARLKETTVELAKARDEALQQAAYKSEWLAQCSHELRTPMNGILGMLDLCLGNGDLTAEQQDLLATAHSCAGSLIQLLNDILDFSKIDAGELSLESIPFAFSDFIQSTMKMINHASSEKGLSITYDIDEALPRYVAGDPGRCRQILTNLIGNAIKFTPRGGHIHLRVSSTPLDPASLVLTNGMYDASGLPLSVNPAASVQSEPPASSANPDQIESIHHTRSFPLSTAGTPPLSGSLLLPVLNPPPSAAVPAASASMLTSPLSHVSAPTALAYGSAVFGSPPSTVVTITPAPAGGSSADSGGGHSNASSSTLQSDSHVPSPRPSPRLSPRPAFKDASLHPPQSRSTSNSVSADFSTTVSAPRINNNSTASDNKLSLHAPSNSSSSTSAVDRISSGSSISADEFNRWSGTTATHTTTSLSSQVTEENDNRISNSGSSASHGSHKKRRKDDKSSKRKHKHRDPHKPGSHYVSALSGDAENVNSLELGPPFNNKAASVATATTVSASLTSFTSDPRGHPSTWATRVSVASSDAGAQTHHASTAVDVKTDEHDKGHMSASLNHLAYPPVRFYFAVSDNGPGISKHNQSKLFQAFRQADKSTGRKYGGTGLGLAITKRLVNMSKGDVAVHSDLGRGASFVFDLLLGAIPENEITIDQLADVHSNQIGQIGAPLFRRTTLPSQLGGGHRSNQPSISANNANNGAFGDRTGTLRTSVSQQHSREPSRSSASSAPQTPNSQRGGDGIGGNGSMLAQAHLSSTSSGVESESGDEDTHRHIRSVLRMQTEDGGSHAPMSVEPTSGGSLADTDEEDSSGRWSRRVPGKGGRRGSLSAANNPIQSIVSTAAAQPAPRGTSLHRNYSSGVLGAEHRGSKSGAPAPLLRAQSSGVPRSRASTTTDSLRVSVMNPPSPGVVSPSTGHSTTSSVDFMPLPEAGNASPTLQPLAQPQPPSPILPRGSPLTSSASLNFIGSSSLSKPRAALPQLHPNGPTFSAIASTSGVAAVSQTPPSASSRRLSTGSPSSSGSSPHPGSRTLDGGRAQKLIAQRLIDLSVLGGGGGPGTPTSNGGVSPLTGTPPISSAPVYAATTVGVFSSTPSPTTSSPASMSYRGIDLDTSSNSNSDGSGVKSLVSTSSLSSTAPAPALSLFIPGVSLSSAGLTLSSGSSTPPPLGIPSTPSHNALAAVPPTPSSGGAGMSVAAILRFSPLVLVVDDNVINCKVAAKMLEREGCTVVFTNSGEDSLRLLDEHGHFCLISSSASSPSSTREHEEPISCDVVSAASSTTTSPNAPLSSLLSPLTPSTGGGTAPPVFASPPVFSSLLPSSSSSEYHHQRTMSHDQLNSRLTEHQMLSDPRFGSTSLPASPLNDPRGSQSAVAGKSQADGLSSTNELSAKLIKLQRSSMVASSTPERSNRRQKFDVVFMDVQMPVMDGLETTQIIRQRERALHEHHTKSPSFASSSSDGRSLFALYHVPIVALTANAISGDKEKCFQAGMDKYIPKPFQRHDIRAVFSQLSQESAFPAIFADNEGF